MARRTTTLGGVTIPAGTTVMLLPGASNRDPRRFEEPHRFDVARKNASSQLAFSRGVHSCIGQPLARTEARVTLERMLDRMENISILESDHGAPSARRYEYSPTYIFRGLMSLSLAYTPVDAAPRQPAP